MSAQLDLLMDTSGRELNPGERGEALGVDIYPGCPLACGVCDAPSGHWSTWFHVAPSPWASGLWPYNPHETRSQEAGA